MIKSIKIKNFQSHVNSELNLSENLTSIVGLSDSGKSSFIRALNALIYRGPFYMRNFTTEGSVEITLSNAVIKREQGIAETKKCPSCKNVILPNTPQCPACLAIIDKTITSDKYIMDGVEKEKFGVKLPDFITDVLKFKETYFVDIVEKLNFASQHQDMFFIGSTYAGGARNKILSCLVPDSDKIDILLKKVGTDLQEKKILSESLMKDNISIENKIQQGKLDYEEIESLEKEIDKDQKELISLKNKVIRLKQLQKSLESCYTLSRELGKSEKITGNLKKIETHFREKFVPLVQQLEKLKRLSVVPRKIQMPKFEEVYTFNLDGYVDQLSKVKRLRIINSNIQDLSIFGVQQNGSLSIIEKQISKLKDDHNDCLGSALCVIINDKYCDSCLKKLKL